MLDLFELGIVRLGEQVHLLDQDFERPDVLILSLEFGLELGDFEFEFLNFFGDIASILIHFQLQHFLLAEDVPHHRVQLHQTVHVLVDLLYFGVVRPLLYFYLLRKFVFHLHFIHYLLKGL